MHWQPIRPNKQRAASAFISKIDFKESAGILSNFFDVFFINPFLDLVPVPVVFLDFVIRNNHVREILFVMNPNVQVIRWDTVQVSSAL